MAISFCVNRKLIRVKPTTKMKRTVFFHLYVQP